MILEKNMLLILGAVLQEVKLGLFILTQERKLENLLVQFYF